MRRLMLFSAIALFVAGPAAADTREIAFMVRPGHPVRLVAVNQSSGDSNSTTWAIVTLDGTLTAVDVQFGVRAQTETMVRRPRRHRASVDCGNHLATIVSCTLEAR